MFCRPRESTRSSSSWKTLGSVARMGYGSVSQPWRNTSPGRNSWVQGRNFRFIVKLSVHYRCCSLLFLVDIGFFNQLYHFTFVSYLVYYHMFLLTNFSAIFWQQIDFVQRLLIKLLWSIKTIVPIVINTSLRAAKSYTATGKRWIWKNILLDQISCRLQSVSTQKWSFNPFSHPAEFL